MRHAHAGTLSARQRKAGWLLRAANLLLSIAREIFDEAAYERFLTRNRAASSVETYKAFREDFEGLNTKRPRCC